MQILNKKRTDSFKQLLKHIVQYVFRLFVVFTLISVAVVWSIKYFNPPTWSWKLQKASPIWKSDTQKIRHHWVSSEAISSSLKLAVIAAEDQHYPSHHGFDFEAMTQAILDKLDGKKLRGASTITQQTAKNLFLWPGKNLFRKLLEAWFTVLLEMILDKQRILEVYLNIVEFAPGVMGVEAASQHFYRSSAATLSVRQAATLAAVLPNPYRFQVNRPSLYIHKRILWIEQQMKQLGYAYLKIELAKTRNSTIF